MAKADFWRDLADRFRQLDPYGFVRAEWIVPAPQPQQSLAHWKVTGREPARSGFETLARRGGCELDPNTDSLGVWLESLRARDINCTSVGSGINPSGDVLDQHFYGTISQAAEASMQLCYMMESQVLEDERIAALRRKVDVIPVDQPGAARQVLAETIGEQIKRLREECRWTIEDLAETADLHARSVARHESGDVTPYPRTLSIYERLFSKQLKRQIVISKMP